MAEYISPDQELNRAADQISALLSQEAEAPAPAPEPEEPKSRFSTPVEQKAVERENPQETAPAVEDVQAEEPAQETQPAQEATEAKAPAPAVQQPVVVPVLDAAKQAELNQYTQQANFAVAQAQAIIATNFPEIKTWDDLRRTAATDPDRYNQYVIAKGQYDEAMQVKTRVDQYVGNQLSEAQKAWQAKEAERLPDLIPDLKDPEKAPKVANAIREYAKKQGITEADLGQANATQLSVLHKAMLFEQHQQQEANNAKTAAANLANAQRKAQTAPPVQKPGATRPQANAEDKQMTAFKRLQRNPSSMDAATEMFKTIL